jgi:AMMECR1 domain-containing protein
LVKDISELDPKKYGIIVKTTPLLLSEDVIFNGHFIAKTGLLLPEFAGIDTTEKQISIACQKAGINPEKEKIITYRFSAEKYEDNN